MFDKLFQKKKIINALILDFSYFVVWMIGTFVFYNYNLLLFWILSFYGFLALGLVLITIRDMQAVDKNLGFFDEHNNRFISFKDVRKYIHELNENYQKINIDL